VNTNEYTDLPRPTIPKIHQIGGIALKVPKKLDEVGSFWVDFWGVQR
jgi:hypothetical protein